MKKSIIMRYVLAFVHSYPHWLRNVYIPSRVVCSILISSRVLAILLWICSIAWRTRTALESTSSVINSEEPFDRNDGVVWYCSCKLNTYKIKEFSRFQYKIDVMPSETLCKQLHYFLTLQLNCIFTIDDIAFSLLCAS